MKNLNQKWANLDNVLTKEQMRNIVGSLGAGDTPSEPEGDGGSGGTGGGYKCCLKTDHTKCSKCNPNATLDTHHCPQSEAEMVACDHVAS